MFSPVIAFGGVRGLNPTTTTIKKKIQKQHLIIQLNSLNIFKFYFITDEVPCIRIFSKLLVAFFSLHVFVNNQSTYITFSWLDHCSTLSLVPSVQVILQIFNLALIKFYLKIDSSFHNGKQVKFCLVQILKFVEHKKY